MNTQLLTSLVNRLLKSYANIFFMDGKWTGLIMLAITFLLPVSALSGLICVASAYTFAWLMGYKKVFLAHGYYWYNTLLMGFGVSHLLAVNELMLLMLIFAGIFTFLLSAALSQVMQEFFKLPVLSLPFVIVGWCMYLAVQQFPNLPMNYTSDAYLAATFDVLPQWLNGFYKSLGSLLYMPYAVIGLLVSIVLLCFSRILFLLALGGYLWGEILTGLLTGSFDQAWQDGNGFNYVLIAMALGGTFNLPTIRSYGITFFAVTCAVPVMAASNAILSIYHLPILTLPFVVITLLYQYVLDNIGYINRPLIHKDSPEQSLEYFLTTQQRFSPTLVTLSLPYYGQWNVWQGFNGKWTHQGLGQFAYDFVICDENGKTFKNDGKLLADYYGYQQSVLSPVRGKVIQVVNYLPDHPIGSVDEVNHFGNYCLIEDVRGFFVKIAHFAYYGIDVFEGSWVEPGSYLGRCGNSGYSPQPHIHIHVQGSAFYEAETIPFRFLNYIEKNKQGVNQYFEHGLPTEKQNITQAPPQAYYNQLTTYVLDSCYDFDIFDNGLKKGEITIEVKMAVDMSMYFSCHNAKLYFGKSEGSFYCYHLEGNDPYLRMLYLALSSMPLYFQEGLTWQDTLPTSVVVSGIEKFKISMLNLMIPKWLTSQVTYTFKSPNSITGLIKNGLFKTAKETSITLDPFNKIESIAVNKMVLKRNNKNDNKKSD